ncbi:MAG TPA: phenylalanine--tRNA ligase subunit beta, partial [Anaerolineales bacterium]|nr:phenylalanine--tRNA ligase subunit beta [Anaerolineales bacterium]
YDVLKERVGGKNVKIITRPAEDGEKLATLDGVERTLTSTNVLVCDEKGSLSLAGVMGGAESEVTDKTRNILLEGAAWNFINIRKTAEQHNLPSEASFRFSRGVHPSLAETGVKRGLQLMAEWSGGVVAPGLVDAYPLPPKDSVVDVTPQDVKRLLGIDLTVDKIAELLTHLEFKCEIINNQLRVTAPSHRLDIGEGDVGLADVLEEVARSYGYDNIPETRMADALPPQIGNPVHEWEEHVRDLLVRLGMQEIVSYRMTSPEREGRVAQYNDYVTLANPITPERRVMRRSLLASVLEVMEKNARAESISLFEIGPVFEPVKDDLPNEPRRLVLVMTGLREALAWDVKDSPSMDFYDMKGRLELLLGGLHYTDVSYTAADSVPYLHPGKAAQIQIGGKVIGVFGELHPLVKDKYEVGDAPVLAAEFDLDALRSVSPTYGIKPVADVPPVFEDIAVILDESVPASKVEALIRQTGGKVLTNAKLFDVYRDEKIGAGKKSLAYSLTYQSDKTMTDADAAAIRKKIVKRLEFEVGAKLRS